MELATAHCIGIRRVRRDEVEQMRDLRLAALRGAPEAFARTYDEEASQPPAFWEERTRAAAESDAVATFVAVAAERHVATATGLLRGASDHAVLVGMWVVPGWRRQGVGLRLIGAVSAWAAAHGVTAVELVVHLANDEARRFYERAGFVLVGAPETGEGGKLEQRMLLRLSAGEAAAAGA